MRDAPRLYQIMVQRGNKLQTRAFFPPCFPPTSRPPPRTAFTLVSSFYQSATAFSFGRHHRGCYGRRAAWSWLLWSAGGVVVVTVMRRLPSLPPCRLPEAARPAIYQSRQKKRRPTSLPPTSYQRRNVHSPLVLRGCYGRAVCFPLVAPRFARLLETQRTFIINPVGVCSTDINLRPLHPGNPECTEVSECVNES